MGALCTLRNSFARFHVAAQERTRRIHAAEWTMAHDVTRMPGVHRHRGAGRVLFAGLPIRHARSSQHRRTGRRKKRGDLCREGGGYCAVVVAGGALSPVAGAQPTIVPRVNATRQQAMKTLRIV